MAEINKLPALPLGTSDFKTLRLQKKIYVDKTALVYQLASRVAKFFLTRPRRFGKSLLVSTFAALFRDGLKNFSGLAIEKLWTDKTYKVVTIDFSEIKNAARTENFKDRLGELLSSSFEPFGFQYDESWGVNIISQLGCWLETQRKGSFVLLIDEYDAPLTACLDDQERFEEVQRQLAKFYAIVKSCDGCWRFVFVTGITKLYQTSIFSSEFNHFIDLTLDPLFAPLVGFTEEDIDRYFPEYVEKAAKALNLPTTELRCQLRENYGGYCFDEHVSTHLYAPWSALNFLSCPKEGFEPYWVQSGGHILNLLRYLQPDSLKAPENYASEQYVSLNELECSSAFGDLRDVLLLTQAGYLTLKRRNGRFFCVGYPNQEVADSLGRLYRRRLLQNQTLSAVGAGELAAAVRNGNTDLFFDQANHAFAGIDYQRHPISNEKHCQAFLQIFLAGLGFSVVPERHNALGRSDLEIDAPKIHWVLELKYQRKGESVDALLTEAVAQIREKQYGATSAKPLIRVAAVFSEEKRMFVRWQQVDSMGMS